MIKTFILCEKPSVAADFQAALGGVKKDGYFESEDYVIAFCLGHLLELYEPDDYNPEFKKWELAALPIIPQEFKYKPIVASKRQLEIVSGLLKQEYEKIIIATDAGREGELIARLVLNYSGCNAANIFRFWSSEALTKDVILNTLANKLKPLADFDLIYKQGMIRQQGDWLVGINFSRYYSINFDANFSFGRVQTCLLNIIYEREQAIGSFKKKPFFKLHGVFSKDSIPLNTCLYIDDKDAFDQKNNLQSIIDQISKPDQSAMIEKVEITTKTEQPPFLYSLTSLQKAANVLFNFKAAKTLEIAQVLYEKYKCLSYPRTSSRHLPASAMPIVLKSLELFKGENPLDESKINSEYTRVFDETKIEDHYALIPIDRLPETAADDEKKLFQLIIKSFIAAFSFDHVYEKTDFTVSVAGFKFKGSIKVILNPGFKNLVANEEEPDEEISGNHQSISPLPFDVKEGDIVRYSKSVIKESYTKPPKKFSEATLLSVMEKHGLGTSATRAAIIEILFSRQYMALIKNAISITPKGAYLIKHITHPDISTFIKAETTSSWERQLEENPVNFFISLTGFVDSLKIIKTINLVKEDLPFSDIGSCPLCKAPIKKGQTNYYCSNYKNDCKFSIGLKILNIAISIPILQELLSGKKTKPFMFINRAKKSFVAAIYLQESKIIFDFN